MPSQPPSPGLWISEADLAARLAELAKIGLPLPEGLEALAEEAPRRLQRPLRQLAGRLRRGDALAEALRVLAALPEPLGALLQIGIAQGRLPEVLEEYARLARIQAEMQQRIRFSLAYPTLLMFLLTLLAFFVHYFITLQFGTIYRNFGVSLPELTLFVLSASKWLPWICAGMTIALAVLPLLLSGMILVRWLAPAIYYIPLLGPLMNTLRMTQLTHWMKLFLAYGVPLPQALRFTATGLHDGYYSPACLRMAAEVEQGQSLRAAAFPGLPPTLAPMLEWGERANALPEAFRAAAEAYEGRAELRGAMVESLITPIFLITFLILACTWILGLLLPMISLIQSLTGGGK